MHGREFSFEFRTICAANMLMKQRLGHLKETKNIVQWIRVEL